MDRGKDHDLVKSRRAPVVKRDKCFGGVEFYIPATPEETEEAYRRQEELERALRQSDSNSNSTSSDTKSSVTKMSFKDD